MHINFNHSLAIFMGVSFQRGSITSLEPSSAGMLHPSPASDCGGHLVNVWGPSYLSRINIFVVKHQWEYLVQDNRYLGKVEFGIRNCFRSSKFDILKS